MNYATPPQGLKEAMARGALTAAANAAAGANLAAEQTLLGRMNDQLAHCQRQLNRLDAALERLLGPPVLCGAGGSPSPSPVGPLDQFVQDMGTMAEWIGRLASRAERTA